MPTDFFRNVDHADCAKVKGCDPVPAIRLYSTIHGVAWSLQVRGQSRIAKGRQGKDFIIAGATCSADDLRALRDAIDVQLREAE